MRCFKNLWLGILLICFTCKLSSKFKSKESCPLSSKLSSRMSDSSNGCLGGTGLLGLFTACYGYAYCCVNWVYACSVVLGLTG
jgi:hypothetical protein